MQTQLPDYLQNIVNFLTKLFQFTLFEINQTPITLISVSLFILVLLTFFVGSLFLNKILFRRLLGRFRIQDGIQYTILRISHYMVIVIGAVFALQFVGINLGGLAIIFGFLSVGIGFGLQNITSNFVSGIILLFERPIEIGDRVTVGDTEGDVTAIKMRAATIQTLDNISIIVPNSEFISGKVINWSHGDQKIRISINVGVSYKSDPDIVTKALMEAAKEHPEVLRDPEPRVFFKNFGDSSWDFTLSIWIGDPKKHMIIRSDIHYAIVHKFREYNIEIPYPQRDLHLRSPLPIPYTTEEHPENA